jgi:hypothetical protein
MITLLLISGILLLTESFRKANDRRLMSVLLAVVGACDLSFVLGNWFGFSIEKIITHFFR